MARKEQLWGKVRGEVRGEVGGGSEVQRCGYCIKKGMACEWPPASSKARSCSQCREHKITCVVGGVGNKKRKERGSLEKVSWMKSKTAESVVKDVLEYPSKPYIS